MIELVTAFIERLAAGDTQAVAVLVVFILLTRLRNVIDFYDHLRDRKMRSISQLLDVKGISEESRYVLEQTVDQIAFYRATGIHADEKGRKKIASLLQESKGVLSVLGLRRVRSYVRYEKDELTLPLSQIDHIELIFNIIFFVCILFLLISISFSFYAQTDLTLESGLAWAVMIFVVMLLSVLPLRTILHYLMARKVKKVFVEFEQKSQVSEE